MDFLGNASEETVIKFLNKLDSEIDIGPKELEGFSYDPLKLEDTIKCSSELARTLMEKPTEFLYDENEQIYLLGFDDERIYLDSDDTSSNFHALCEIVVSKLPDLPFDLDSHETVSAQVETANLYKSCVMNSICGDAFKEDIYRILDGYDFTRMKDKNNVPAFTKLIVNIQENSTPVEKVLLMCLTTKCVSSKFKKSSSYGDYLEEDISNRLREILRKEAALNYGYDQKFNLAQTPAEKFSIGESLKKKRQEEIFSMFENDEIVMFAYKINALNVNCIPGPIVRKIRKEADIFLDDINFNSIDSDGDVVKLYKKKLVKRGCRLYLRRMKQIRFKILASGEKDLINEDVLIPKY